MCLCVLNRAHREAVLLGTALAALFIALSLLHGHPAGKGRDKHTSRRSCLGLGRGSDGTCNGQSDQRMHAGAP